MSAVPSTTEPMPDPRMGTRSSPNPSRSGLKLLSSSHYAALAEEFFVSLEAVGRSTKTLRSYADVLYRFFSGGNQLTRSSMELYLARRRTQVAAISVNDEVRVLRRYCNWLVDYGLLEANPTARLQKLSKTEPPIKVADADVVKVLLRAAQKSSHPLRDQALILTLADSGARVGELLRITIENLHVIESPNGARAEAWVTGKGGKLRRLLLGPVATDALQRWLPHRPAAAGNVIWWSDRGAPLTASGVSELLERLAKTAGYTGAINPHAFRHGAALDFLEHNQDIRTLQSMLGHADLATTAKYLRLADRRLTQAHDLVSNARFGQQEVAIVADNATYAELHTEEGQRQEHETGVQKVVREFLYTVRGERTRETEKLFQWHLHKFQEWMADQGVFDLGQITPDMLAAWRESLAARWQTSTRKAAAASVQHFLRWCFGRGLIGTDVLAVLDRWRANKGTRKDDHIVC